MASDFASQKANRNICDLESTLARIVFSDPDQLLSSLCRFLQRTGAWRNFERDWPLERREFPAIGFRAGGLAWLSAGRPYDQRKPNKDPYPHQSDRHYPFSKHWSAVWSAQEKVGNAEYPGWPSLGFRRSQLAYNRCQSGARVSALLSARQQLIAPRFSHACFAGRVMNGLRSFGLRPRTAAR